MFARARRLIVRERPGNRVGGPTRPLVHLALVVRLRIGDLIAGGDRLYLLLAVAEIGEIAEIEMLDRMTDRTDFLVDLETALQRSPVVGAEDAVERPLLMRQRRALVGGSEREPGPARRQPAPRRPKSASAFQGFASGAPAPLSRAPPPSTVAPMLLGSGCGRSSLPISGSRMSMCRK